MNIELGDLLDPVRDTPSLASARRWVKLQGHDLQPFGCTEINDNLSYYYFFLPDRSLVELEVLYNPELDSFTRTVTAVQEPEPAGGE